jgi:hypothetical protein
MIIDMDIEAMNMNYVQQWYSKVIDGGIKYGEIKSMYYTAGRQAGKSTLNQYYGKLYDTNLCKEIFLPMQPEPKYKFSRANWYVAEYNNKHHFEVLEWCTQQFGPYPALPDAWSRWVNMYSEKIHFRDEKDYNWFVLRWS